MSKKCPYEYKDSDITYGCFIIDLVKKELKYYEPCLVDDGGCTYDNKNKCPIYSEIKEKSK